MVDKIFVTAQSLLSDSFRLGLKIMADGFHPDHIISI
jgi:hypoxanthine phosphoribosyltransferase